MCNFGINDHDDYCYTVEQISKRWNCEEVKVLELSGKLEIGICAYGCIVNNLPGNTYSFKNETHLLMTSNYIINQKDNEILIHLLEAVHPYNKELADVDIQITTNKLFVRTGQLSKYEKDNNIPIRDRSLHPTKVGVLVHSNKYIENHTNIEEAKHKPVEPNFFDENYKYYASNLKTAILIWQGLFEKNNSYSVGLSYKKILLTISISKI